jgi:hypothetical protein
VASISGIDNFTANFKAQDMAPYRKDHVSRSPFSHEFGMSRRGGHGRTDDSAGLIVVGLHRVFELDIPFFSRGPIRRGIREFDEGSLDCYSVDLFRALTDYRLKLRGKAQKSGPDEAVKRAVGIGRQGCPRQAEECSI